MKAKATKDFNSVNRRFKVGDEVTIEEVGETLFFLNTDAAKRQEKKSSKPDDKSV